MGVILLTQMTRDAECYIAECEQCIHFKSKPQKVAMENIQATHPLQLVHLDYLSTETTEGGKDAHMLIVTDYFKQNTQALVISLQTAKCTAKALWGKFIVHFGILESIVSDQGQNFESDLITELCKMAKVQILDQ